MTFSPQRDKIITWNDSGSNSGSKEQMDCGMHVQSLQRQTRSPLPSNNDSVTNPWLPLIHWGGGRAHFLHTD